MIAFIHGYQGPSENKATSIMVLGKKHDEEVVVPVYGPTSEWYYHEAKRVMYKMAYENDRHIRCVIGISLGALAAHFIAKHTGATAICVNPCFKPWEQLVMAEDWKVKCKEMWDRAEAVPDSNSQTIVIRNVDDHLPIEDSKDVADEFHEFSEGGHRATNWDTQIVPLINDIVTRKKELLKLARRACVPSEA